MDTEPLSPDAELIINNNIKAFNEGLKNISVLTQGKVFVCTKGNSEIKIENFETHEFFGPHPSGLSGTHMHFLDPPNAEKTVWSIGYQDVIAIGNLFLTGYINIERTISISGPFLVFMHLMTLHIWENIRGKLQLLKKIKINIFLDG